MLDTLNRQFGIAGQLSFSAKPGDFLIAEIKNRHAIASIALQGAHVMAFQPHGQEPVLWLSPQAKLAAGKSIRGGVPVCWPWFGPHAQDAAKPGHGHARTVPWQVVSAATLSGGETQITLELAESDATRALWPSATPVRLQITVGAAMHLELRTWNRGGQPVAIGEALHTYFQVSDIGATRIHGLDGCAYYDKVDGMARKTQAGAVEIGSEVDRVYINTAADCVIEDAQRRIRIAKQGSQSTIVWNPWAEKADKMGDFGENGWRRMVCVESGNALENGVTLPPGGEHSLSVTYSVEAK
jgi:D-hexose-6-phosphate mutarotase